MNTKRILLLSAYDASSHQYWHQQIIKGFPQHHWQLLTLKDRFFSWRMGGNAMNFQKDYHHQLMEEFDALLATSMTDLSTLVSLYPHLNQIPKTLYFHENQFAYPKNHNQLGLKEIQLRSIYSAMVADSLVFNSKYNHDTFFIGVKSFLKQMPDGVPVELHDQLVKKSTVIPVPIKSGCTAKVKRKINNQLEVVWNHRWEHDKGPETLLTLMRLCHDKPFIKFHVLGQQFKNKPNAFQQIIANHSHQCLNIGFIESRTKYIQVLQQADVVLSTAYHDFQGLAMLEAVACGCKPIIPNRLVYPEYYPQNNCYDSNPDDVLKEAQSIFKLLKNADQLLDSAPDMSWKNLKPFYEKILN